MNTQRKEPLILVINASLDLLNLFHEILDGQGYEVELSNYTFEGIHTIERLKPDLIILDFEREGKPEEWQLLKMIRLHESLAKIPLIVCMAPFNIFLDREKYFQRKNIQLLFAPIEKDEILAVVRQMLEASSSSHQEEA